MLLTSITHCLIMHKKKTYFGDNIGPHHTVQAVRTGAGVSSPAGRADEVGTYRDQPSVYLYDAPPLSVLMENPGVPTADAALSI